MSFTELLLIAIGLSMDAFAVSVCKGLSVQKLKMRHYIITGLYFGGFQALMPFLGFLAGTNFQKAITSFDYIVSFVLLAIIGGNMIKEALEDKEECLSTSFSFKTMLPLAVATSIDALAVGIALVAKGSSFNKSFTSNIFFDIIIIGITTFIISSLGIRIGNVFGTKYKKKAEIAGGIILIALGIKMFLEHFI
jgi:putative Mn2+ efflux pump MntP